MSGSASPPPVDWPLSAGDLRNDAWNQRCALFLSLATAIVTDINVSARPGELLRKGYVEPEIAERADRLVAFGQFAERAHADNEHLANAGLFGTSAAIEAMTMCIASDDVDDSLKSDLQSSAVRAWNFVDAAASLAVSDSKSKYYWQFRCTLRACHVLRAAAAIKPLLSSIIQGGNAAARRADEQQRAAIADFQSTFDTVVQACTTTLTDACPVSTVDIGGLPSWMWRFAAEDDLANPLGVARNTDQAVYLASSVLVALARARSSEIVGDDTARQLFPSERRDWLVQLLLDRDKSKSVDPRFALFGLWALSHLDDTRADLHPLGLAFGTKGLPYTVLPHLAFGPGFDHDRFVDRIGEALTEVLADPARLVEVQSDYRMVIRDYRRDYFAVPVVPLVVMLSARYHPRWLFRRSVGQIFKRVTGAVSANSCDDIPYQLSAGSNGVVFTSYLLTASCAARGSMLKMRGPRRLAQWLPAVTFQDNIGGVGLALLLLLLGGPGAYLAVHHHDTALGIWIGAWIGLVFNILVVPLNKRLWRSAD